MECYHKNLVSADGARWIAECVEEFCPNAERCVDPFHLVAWATEVLEKERRKAWAEAKVSHSCTKAQNLCQFLC